jgi:hypothetical protein
MRIIYIASFILAVLLSGNVAAQDWKARIQSSESREQLREFYKKFNKFGEIRESEIKTKDAEYFVISVAGTRVRQVFLWAYRRDGTKWILEEDYAGDIDEELVWNISNRRFERVRITTESVPSTEKAKEVEQAGAVQRYRSRFKAGR